MDIETSTNIFELAAEQELREYDDSGVGKGK